MDVERGRGLGGFEGKVAGDDEELDEEFDEDELKSRASFLQMQGSKSVEEVAASAGLLLPLRTYS